MPNRCCRRHHRHCEGRGGGSSAEVRRRRPVARHARLHEGLPRSEGDWSGTSPVPAVLHPGTRCSGAGRPKRRLDHGDGQASRLGIFGGRLRAGQSPRARVPIPNTEEHRSVKETVVPSHCRCNDQLRVVGTGTPTGTPRGRKRAGNSANPRGDITPGQEAFSASSSWWIACASGNS
jgi:hypothetical protein